MKPRLYFGKNLQYGSTLAPLIAACVEEEKEEEKGEEKPALPWQPPAASLPAKFLSHLLWTSSTEQTRPDGWLLLSLVFAGSDCSNPITLPGETARRCVPGTLCRRAPTDTLFSGRLLENTHTGCHKDAGDRAGTLIKTLKMNVHLSPDPSAVVCGSQPLVHTQQQNRTETTEK